MGVAIKSCYFHYIFLLQVQVEGNATKNILLLLYDATVKFDTFIIVAEDSKTAS